MEVDPNSQAPVPFDGVPTDASDENDAAFGKEKKKRGLVGKCWWLLKWPLAIIVLPILAYLVVAMIGAWLPVNLDFVPEPNGIEIYIYSGDIHSDIILPLVNEQKDWRENFPLNSFGSSRTDFTHVSIGWGAREFYLETPTWSDLELSTAANALLTPSESVMHVEMIHLRPVISSSMMKTKISKEQYLRMVDFVQGSFEESGGIGGSNPKPTPIEGASYHDRDNFYPAVGSYYLFQTCNCWAGDALRATGIKVGKFTPLPKSVFWHLTQ